MYSIKSTISVSDKRLKTIIPFCIRLSTKPIIDLTRNSYGFIPWPLRLVPSFLVTSYLQLLSYHKRIKKKWRSMKTKVYTSLSYPLFRRIKPPLSISATSYTCIYSVAIVYGLLPSTTSPYHPSRWLSRLTQILSSRYLKIRTPYFSKFLRY